MNYLISIKLINRDINLLYSIYNFLNEKMQTDSMCCIQEKTILINCFCSDTKEQILSYLKDFSNKIENIEIH